MRAERQENKKEVPYQIGGEGEVYLMGRNVTVLWVESLFAFF